MNELRLTLTSTMLNTRNLMLQFLLKTVIIYTSNAQCWAVAYFYKRKGEIILWDL